MSAYQSVYIILIFIWKNWNLSRLLELKPHFFEEFFLRTLVKDAL